jgi:hypothetical protein
MRRMLTLLAAMLLALGMVAGPALAHTSSSSDARAAVCKKAGGTYKAGHPSSPDTDRCVIKTVKTVEKGKPTIVKSDPVPVGKPTVERRYGDSVRINNKNAAKAVYRVSMYDVSTQATKVTYTKLQPTVIRTTIDTYKFTKDNKLGAKVSSKTVEQPGKPIVVKTWTKPGPDIVKKIDAGTCVANPGKNGCPYPV